MVDRDSEVLQAIRNGDVRRFGELVDRHKDKALTLAVRIVGDAPEAEELVQDAFLRAFRALDSFRGDARFSTWFYRILHNVCMTKAIRRSRGDSLTDAMDDHEMALETLRSPAPSVLEALEEKETLAMLHEEMNRLPPQYATALTLFYVQEMGCEEMAAVLQQPEGTVKTNLSRGRAMLRQRVLQRLNSEECAA